MDFESVLFAYAPATSIGIGVVAAAIAVTIILGSGTGCEDCGAKLSFTEGTSCHHCVALKRSILQARGDREKATTRCYTNQP